MIRLVQRQKTNLRTNTYRIIIISERLERWKSSDSNDLLNFKLFGGVPMPSLFKNNPSAFVAQRLF